MLQAAWVVFASAGIAGARCFSSVRRRSFRWFSRPNLFRNKSRSALAIPVKWMNQEKRAFHSVPFLEAGVQETERFFLGESWHQMFVRPGSYPYRGGPYEEMRGSVQVFESPEKLWSFSPSHFSKRLSGFHQCSVSLIHVNAWQGALLHSGAHETESCSQLGPIACIRCGGRGCRNSAT